MPRPRWPSPAAWSCAPRLRWRSPRWPAAPPCAPWKAGGSWRAPPSPLPPEAVTVLAKILDTKRSELAELRRRPLPAPPPLRPVRLSRAAGAPLALITEIKRRSPSAGALSTVLSVAERARAYERAGASMLSVLCDRPYFDGEYAHLAEARAATSLPILCKEFVLDESQLDAARAFGADAVLL